MHEAVNGDGGGTPRLGENDDGKASSSSKSTTEKDAATRACCKPDVITDLRASSVEFEFFGFCVICFSHFTQY